MTNQTDFVSWLCVNMSIFKHIGIFKEELITNSSDPLKMIVSPYQTTRQVESLSLMSSRSFRSGCGGF